jgi:hypothetical protein
MPEELENGSVIIQHLISIEELPYYGLYENYARTYLEINLRDR